jgi:trimeric autotransporter adhesin
MQRLLIAVFLLCAVVAFAQEQPAVENKPAVADQYTIAGKVTDAKGAPIPGASVRVNTGTNMLSEKLSDPDGAFQFEGLPAGSYQLTAEIAGFVKAAKDGVDGAAESSRNLALKLESLPRPPRPQAQPQASAREQAQRKQQQQQQQQQTPALEAPTFQAAQVTDLPGLNQFRPDMSQEAGSTGATASRQDSLLFISGNSASIDAGNFNDLGFRNQVMDAARMMGFQVQEFNPGQGGSGGPGGMGFAGGGGGGGMMMGGGGPGGGGGGPMGGGFGFAGMGGRGGRGASFKQPFVQGSISENYSNSALNARTYSMTGQTVDKPVTIRNSYTLTLSGQLSFLKAKSSSSSSSASSSTSTSSRSSTGGRGSGGGPGGFGGRNSTPSWNFSYSGSRNRSATSTFTTVPTDLERIGDFSQTFAQSTVFDPVTKMPSTVYQPVKLYLNPNDASSQFTNLTSINPIAAQLLQYIPRANMPCALNMPCTRNYILDRSRSGTSDQYQVRISGLRLPRNSISVNYSMSRGNNPNIAAIPILDSSSKTLGQNFGIQGNFTIKSRLVANWNVRVNRNRTESSNAFSYNNDVEGLLGMTGVSKDPINWGPPTISFRGSGDQGLSLASPSINQSQTVTVSGGINKMFKKHSIRGGIDGSWAQRNSKRDSNGRGSYTFSGYATVLLDAQGRQVAGTGYDFADFLLGFPYSTARSFVDPSINAYGNSTYLRNRTLSAYLMDDWRARSNFTINYGIRYEYAGPGFEKYNRLVSLDAAPGFTEFARVFPDQDGPLSGQHFSRSLVNADINNIAPRVGIAWKPTSKSPFVFRAGYGIGYNAGGYMSIVSQISNQSPFALTQNLIADRAAPLTLKAGFPIDPAATISNTFALDPNYKLSYAQQWNLDIQTQIKRIYSLSVTYNGSKGTQLDIRRAPVRNSSSTNFTYLTNGGNSIYHGLAVQLSRRYSHGVNISGSYTLSKTIDDGSSIAQDDAHLAAERALSSQDQRHNFSTNFTYELPVGKNRMFLAASSAKVLNFAAGWTFNGTFSMATGNPLNPSYTSSNGSIATGSFYNSLRPDITGAEISLPKSERTLRQFFNTAAFNIPAGQFGTASRNCITGPGQINLNLSVRKSFTLDDNNRRVDLSWQVQNLLNHPNWGGVSTNISSPTYGQITNMRGMRSMTMQLSVRF